METLNLIKNDPWLEPFADAINGRHQHAIDKSKSSSIVLVAESELTGVLFILMVANTPY